MSNSSDSCGEDSSPASTPRLGGPSPAQARAADNVHDNLDQQHNLQQQLRDLHRRSGESRLALIKRQQQMSKGRGSKDLISQPSTSAANFSHNCSDEPSTSSANKQRRIADVSNSREDMDSLDTPRVMTRALKRKLESNFYPTGVDTPGGSKSTSCKALKLDRSQQQQHQQLPPTTPQPTTPVLPPPPPPSFERRLIGSGRSRRDEQLEPDSEEMQGLDDSVINHEDWAKDRRFMDVTYPPSVCKEGEMCGAAFCDQHEIWFEPKVIKYREIEAWPHMNDCVKTLEVLNIGSSNVLGEFLPFLFLRLPRLRSLGQWLNTMIYGLEILKELPGYENYVNHRLQEFSYSSDRSYYCQPYIGFVPETPDFKNVRKEMVKYSNRSATKLGHKSRNQSAKRNQIMEDIELMATTCPNLRKVNLVIHYKIQIMDIINTEVWAPLLKLSNLVELDLIVMRFQNVKSLLLVIGHRLQKLTVECEEEQGNGSEIVHIARSCPNLVSLRIIVGEKILRGEMTLHFGSNFFRKLERLEVEGNIHLHGFAFLWGHCQNIKYIKIGLVVSNEVTSTNVLIQDVFTLLFQVNKMSHLEELHIKNLKIRTLAMGIFLLDNLPNLKKASNWFLDLPWPEVVIFNRHLKSLKNHGLKLEYDRL